MVFKINITCQQKSMLIKPTCSFWGKLTNIMKLTSISCLHLHAFWSTSTLSLSTTFLVPLIPREKPR